MNISVLILLALSLTGQSQDGLKEFQNCVTSFCLPMERTIFNVWPIYSLIEGGIVASACVVGGMYRDVGHWIYFIKKINHSCKRAWLSKESCWHHKSTNKLDSTVNLRGDVAGFFLHSFLIIGKGGVFGGRKVFNPIQSGLSQM